MVPTSMLEFIKNIMLELGYYNRSENRSTGRSPLQYNAIILEKIVPYILAVIMRYLRYVDLQGRVFVFDAP